MSGFVDTTLGGRRFEDVFTETNLRSLVSATLGGVCANLIGQSYGEGAIDSVTHKVLHGVLGGGLGFVLGGTGGIAQGAIASMIVEGLAESELLDMGIESGGIEGGLTSESLNDRADRARLATATLLMGLGLDDIDIAMETSRNAVENNFVPQLLRALSVLSKIGTKTKGVWKKPPLTRGQIIEKKLGQNLHQNFPTVDKFKDGVATSIKSLDLKAKTYQNTIKLSHTLRKYVDKVARFEKGAVGKQKILPHEVKGRALDLAIPRGGTFAQKQVIKNAVEYGLTKNVTVNVIKF